MDFLLVALGGGLGAMLRYAISLLPYQANFPLKTLIVNLLGALILGFISAKMSAFPELDKRLMLFFGTGLCGGFTTFSTFSLETVQLFQMQKFSLATAYIVLSIIGSLVGIMVGFALSRNFN